MGESDLFFVRISKESERSARMIYIHLNISLIIADVKDDSKE